MNQDDERIKALLASVGEQPGPPLGFTADGIVRGSRRIRLTRWGAGVAAGLVISAAIATVIILTPNRDVGPGTPPPVTTTELPTTTPMPTTTTSTTEPTPTP